MEPRVMAILLTRMFFSMITLMLQMIEFLPLGVKFLGLIVVQVEQLQLRKQVRNSHLLLSRLVMLLTLRFVLLNSRL